MDGDRAAALLAGAVGADALIILSNVPGLLAELPRRDAAWSATSPPTQLDAAEGLAQGRMKKKVLAAQEALERACPPSILADSRRPQPVAAALAGEGTVIGERLLADDRSATRPSPPFLAGAALVEARVLT